MQEAIIKLKLLGQMPDAVKDDPTVETINKMCIRDRFYAGYEGFNWRIGSEKRS